MGSPADAQHLGIGVIYQDFKLVPALSVAENILLGSEPVRGRTPLIDRTAMREKASAALSQLGELDAAWRVQLEALAIRERLAPDSLTVAMSLSGLADLARDRSPFEQG